MLDLGETPLAECRRLAAGYPVTGVRTLLASALSLGDPVRVCTFSIGYLYTPRWGIFINSLLCGLTHFIATVKRVISNFIFEEV